MPDKNPASAPHAIATDPEPDAPEVPGPRPRSVATRVVRQRTTAAPAKPSAVKRMPAKERKPKAPARPGRDVVRVKVGSAEVWMASAIATALSARDRKKLKAVLKRARKRASRV